MATNKLGEGCRLVPVFGEAGCCGHLLKSANGFRAFDHDGAEIGVFQNIDHGITALLDQTIGAKID